MARAEGEAPELDLVVYGASGFVGRLTACYLAEHAPDGVRIGLAGRSLERLAAVRAELGSSAADWPLMQADSGDIPSLADLAASTRVVVSTVGPYLRHGLPLVAACARAGTDYADLAGEVMFVRRSIDEYHDLANATGARIVHACGFDSVPSDIGVLLLHERAQADGAGDLLATTLVLLSVRGGVSGGTIDSFRNQLDAVRADSSLRRLVADPYALSPDRAAEPAGGVPPGREQVAGKPAPARQGPRPSWRRRDPELGIWTAPFVMSSYNTRIVRRSNALAGFAYGRELLYREVMSAGTGPLAPLRAAAITAALGGLAGGMAVRPVRAVLDRLLPAPGTGPDEGTRRSGHFRMQIHTRTSGGARYTATIAASGDPGYAATAVMLGESALSLLLDRDSAPRRSGVLTPATALGRPLAKRLRSSGFDLVVSRRGDGDGDGAA